MIVHSPTLGDPGLDTASPHKAFGGRMVGSVGRACPMGGLAIPDGPYTKIGLPLVGWLFPAAVVSFASLNVDGSFVRFWVELDNLPSAVNFRLDFFPILTPLPVFNAGMVGVDFSRVNTAGNWTILPWVNQGTLISGIPFTVAPTGNQLRCSVGIQGHTATRNTGTLDILDAAGHVIPFTTRCDSAKMNGVTFGTETLPFAESISSPDAEYFYLRVQQPIHLLGFCLRVHCCAKLNSASGLIPVGGFLPS